MRASSITTITTFLALVAAAPHFGRRHQHNKRQDWGAIDWATVKYDFSNVDWNTVNYDVNNVDWATVFDTATPAAATPVAAVAATTTAQASATPAAAGNVQYTNVVTVVSTPATSVSSNGKRGLGWDPSSLSSTASKLAGTVSWYFNWSPTPSSDMPSGWEFYANIWGSGGIENLASKLSGSPKLIGFNEPDSTTQANIGVSEAISLYQQYLTPLKSAGKISELGTPAVTNSQNAGEGLNYLSSFVSGCTGCDLDFAVVHWYAESLDDFKNHVTQAHQMTGLPVNVAEFAYTYAECLPYISTVADSSRSWNSANEPSADEVMTFMTSAIAWLDAQSFVSAYAWFGSMYVSEAKYPALGSANSLVVEALDSLTSLGSAYCQ